ncbi:hypothetical protein EVAR_83712_1 [Eumeta japonica]|uniref:Uncharacterized protein n=1 Tax=Eumeta variegata TaxID=151549 RepID=A0A4C1WAE6_EUMVA|nr:hypothetical protein EVAR_83712_1 [Eumeta japonica]
MVKRRRRRDTAVRDNADASLTTYGPQTRRRRALAIEYKIAAGIETLSGNTMRIGSMLMVDIKGEGVDPRPRGRSRGRVLF